LRTDEGKAYATSPADEKQAEEDGLDLRNRIKSAYPYCFKQDPNVTLLVEQEADAVARDEKAVTDRIREWKRAEPGSKWSIRSAALEGPF
jgi:hypothetical protein